MTVMLHYLVVGRLLKVLWSYGIRTGRYNLSDCATHFLHSLIYSVFFILKAQTFLMNLNLRNGKLILFKLRFFHFYI